MILAGRGEEIATGMLRRLRTTLRSKPSSSAQYRSQLDAQRSIPVFSGVSQSWPGVGGTLVTLNIYEEFSCERGFKSLPSTGVAGAGELDTDEVSKKC